MLKLKEFFELFIAFRWIVYSSNQTTTTKELERAIIKLLLNSFTGPWLRRSGLLWSCPHDGPLSRRPDLLDLRGRRSRKAWTRRHVQDLSAQSCRGSTRNGSTENPGWKPGFSGTHNLWTCKAFKYIFFHLDQLPTISWPLNHA